MNRLKFIFELMAIGLIIGVILGVSYPTHAAATTQGEYAVMLASRLGLGDGLKAEQAIIVLDAVGITPTGGWNPTYDVTCELVAEVQIRAIKSSQMGVIKRAPEDVTPLLIALSDQLGVCTPPKVTIYPTVTTPAPPIAPETKGGGGAAETGSASN